MRTIKLSKLRCTTSRFYAQLRISLSPEKAVAMRQFCKASRTPGICVAESGLEIVDSACEGDFIFFERAYGFSSIFLRVPLIRRISEEILLAVFDKDSSAQNHSHIKHLIGAESPTPCRENILRFCSNFVTES